MEIAVGLARRDLPLFSCSCTLHRLHATDVVGAAQQALPRLLQSRPPSSCASAPAATTETGPVAHPAGLLGLLPVAFAGAESGPFVSQMTAIAFAAVQISGSGGCAAMAA